MESDVWVNRMLGDVAFISRDVSCEIFEVRIVREKASAASDRAGNFHGFVNYAD